MVLLPREIRVTREQRERLVLCVTFGFQRDHEAGDKERGEALPREWLPAAGFLGHSILKELTSECRQTVRSSFYRAASSVCHVSHGWRVFERGPAAQGPTCNAGGPCRALPDLNLPRVHGEEQHDGKASQQAQVLDDKRHQDAASPFILLADLVHLREHIS